MYKTQVKTPVKNNALRSFFFDMDLIEVFKIRKQLSIFDKVLDLELDNSEIKKLEKIESAFLKKVGNFKNKSSKYILYVLTEILENFFFYHDDTVDHFKRVGRLSGFLTEKYTGSIKFSEEIEFFSVIHDIGKLGIPDSIMKKTNKLTMDEFKVMKRHTQIGQLIIANLNLGSVCENIVRYHHEKWNGKGYHGLARKDIPVEARIVAFADVYDALRGKRCYKVSFTHEEAKKIIIFEKGRHFDPKLVDIFLEHEDEFKSIYENF